MLVGPHHTKQQRATEGDEGDHAGLGGVPTTLIKGEGHLSIEHADFVFKYN